MNEGLYDYLASFGFKSVNSLDLVWRMKRAELIEFAKGAEAITVYAQESSRTPYEFSASLTYAGDSSPCAALACRMERVQELSYFTALYADRVLVASLFPSMSADWSLEMLRGEVAVAVASTLHLKPLVIAGLIQYTHHDHCNVCLDCYANLSGKTSEEWGRLRGAIEREFRERVKYYLVRDETGTYAVPEGADDLFDAHTLMEMKIPESMRNVVRRRGRWRIPEFVLDEIKLPLEYANDVAVDILGRDLAASRFGTGYLTRREIDLRVVTPALANAHSDTILNRTLGHQVPVLEGITSENLLKLRGDEADAFKSYQRALRQAAIQSAADGQADLTEVFRDVVEPEIRRMNEALRTARRTLVRGLGADVAGATAYVSIAAFAGIITPGIAGVLAALGGAHFTNEITEKLSKLVKQEPESARENPFYFLWRASRTAKGNKKKGRRAA